MRELLERQRAAQVTENERKRKIKVEIARNNDAANEDDDGDVSEVRPPSKKLRGEGGRPLMIDLT